jgi:cytochrome P450
MSVAAAAAAPTTPAPLVAGLPLLGSAIQMARDSLSFFVATYLRHGPIFRVRVPGRVLTVMAGPEANVFIAKEADGLLRSRETWLPFVRQFGAERNLLSEDGEMHSRLRKLMKRAHGRSMAGPHVGMLSDVVRRRARALPVGKRLRVIAALRPMIAEQLGRLMTGRSAPQLTDDLARVNLDATRVYVVGARPELVLRLPLYRRRLRRVLALGEAVLAEHRSGPRDLSSPDLVDDLLAAAAASPTLFSETDLRLAAIGPFIAGLDTVANGCAFLLYELLSRGYVRARVVEEADAFFARGELTLDALRALRTLHLAAMETLRLHPVAPALLRTAARDFTFEGHSVREGDPVLVATAVSHFLPSLWQRPSEFDVGRFEEGRNEHRKPGAYAPYGLGPHTSLGAGLAEVQIVLLVASLLHEVELRLDPPGYVLHTIQAPGPTPDARFGMAVVRRRA